MSSQASHRAPLSPHKESSVILSRLAGPQRWSRSGSLEQCFSTAGPRPGTGPWHQLYSAASGSPGSCHFSFLSIFHK